MDRQRNVPYQRFKLPTLVVKVSRNSPERRSGAWKFKLGAFRLQKYSISQTERTFLGLAR